MVDGERAEQVPGNGLIGLTVRFDADVSRSLLAIEGAAIEHVCEAGLDHHFVARSLDARPFLELHLEHGRIDIFPSNVDGWTYWCGETELRPEPQRIRVASSTSPLADSAWIDSGKAGVALLLSGPQAKHVLQVEGSIQEIVLWQNLLWLELYGSSDRRPLLTAGSERALLSFPGAKSWTVMYEERMSRMGSTFRYDEGDVEITQLARTRNGGPSAVKVEHRPTGTTVTVDDQPTTTENKARALALIADRLRDDDA